MGANKAYSIVILMVAACFISSNIQAAPRSTPVTVVNDAASPVPVTGTVDANVVGTPGVTIENGPLEPVPVTVHADTPNLAFFNGRITPDQINILDIPLGFNLLITDIVIQNRGPGDVPVAETEYSRIRITSGDSNPSFTVTVVGNQTLNLGLTTGIIYSPGTFGSYIRNVISSTAPFFEYIITGRFVLAP